MSTTDLLNGTDESLPTYNVKNNCTVENLNTTGQITNITPLFYAILQNQQYLDVILRLKNTARNYYNSSRKNFCSTVNLSSVSGFDQERITIYLPTAGGILTRDPCYVDYDYTHRTLLMRILPTGVLPTNWSDVVGQSASVPVNMLTDNEKVIYMYLKNADFFTRVLQLFKNSFQYYDQQKFQCYKLVFPSDFYEGTEQERTFVITSDYLRTIYRNFLYNPRYIPYTALPAPICTVAPAACAEWNPQTQPI
jgi:hypothetical protein